MILSGVPSSLFTNIKLIEFCIAMFGVYAVYILHAIVYERIIMSPYQNKINNQKQFFNSTAGFVLLKTTLCWIYAEVWARFMLKKEQIIVLPNKKVFICGLFVFLSGILFNQGIYYASFRFSFFVKSSAFIFAPIFAFLVDSSSTFKPSASYFHLKDIILGLVIFVGMLYFWFDDPQMMFYIPILPGVVSVIMIGFSAICQAILSRVQTSIKQEHSPGQSQMLLSITRMAFMCSLGYAILTNNLLYSLRFCYEHAAFILDIILLSFLSFLGQLFIYRSINTFDQNITPFLVSTRKILTIHISFLFTIHQHTRNQIWIITGVWLCVVVLSFMIVKREMQNQKAVKIKKGAYREVHQITMEDIQTNVI